MKGSSRNRKNRFKKTWIRLRKYSLTRRTSSYLCHHESKWKTLSESKRHLPRGRISLRVQNNYLQDLQLRVMLRNRRKTIRSKVRLDKTFKDRRLSNFLWERSVLFTSMTLRSSSLWRVLKDGTTLAKSLVKEHSEWSDNVLTKLPDKSLLSRSWPSVKLKSKRSTSNSFKTSSQSWVKRVIRIL